MLARKLSGKHIGQVITLTVNENHLITDKVVALGQFEGRTVIEFANTRPTNKDLRLQYSGYFDVDPNAEVAFRNEQPKMITVTRDTRIKGFTWCTSDCGRFHSDGFTENDINIGDKIDEAMLIK